MICFPNAKINIGLFITEKRPDGFHNIETVFFPVQICDMLEFVELKDDTETKMSVSGISIDGNSNDNLCIKAYRLLKNDFPQLPAIHIHLHKTIPIGAGLGGGSSDAAFMLKKLSFFFDLELDENQLLSYAAKLGSDCSFFIKNKPALAHGKGEILSDIETDLGNYSIVVIYPGLHISTKDAYSGIIPRKPNFSIEQIVKQPVEDWNIALYNDFEGTVFKKYPTIATIKELLYKHGATYSAMTGSGSALFGLFHKSIQFPDFKTIFPDYLVCQL